MTTYERLQSHLTRLRTSHPNLMSAVDTIAAEVATLEMERAALSATVTEDLEDGFPPSTLLAMALCAHLLTAPHASPNPLPTPL